MKKTETILSILYEAEINVSTSLSSTNDISFYFDEGLAIKLKGDDHNFYIKILNESDNKRYRALLSDENATNIGSTREVIYAECINPIINKAFDLFNEVNEKDPPENVFFWSYFILIEDPNMTVLYHYTQT